MHIYQTIRSNIERIGNYDVVPIPPRRLGDPSHHHAFFGLTTNTAPGMFVKMANPSSPFAADLLRREAKLLKKCCHPHILQLRDKGDFEFRFLDGTVEHTPYLVLDFCGTDLFNWTRGGIRTIEWSIARNTIRVLSDTVRYLRNNKIVHGDIRPMNVCVSPHKTWPVTLVDFGSAIQISKKPESLMFRWGEHLPLDEFKTDAVDVFSLGAIAWFLTCSDSHMRRRTHYPRSDPFRKNVPEVAKTILSQIFDYCFLVNASERNHAFDKIFILCNSLK